MIGLQKQEYSQNGENHTKHPASGAVDAAWRCLFSQSKTRDGASSAPFPSFRLPWTRFNWICRTRPYRICRQSWKRPNEEKNCYLWRTIGPCHVNDVPEREDVSEGNVGLPMRMAVRIVHAADCRPIENADVEIWHTDHRGIYSGREAAEMCTSGDAEALSGLAFRGRQLTNSDGQATFLTTYPGWYHGRTSHIHCRILAAGKGTTGQSALFRRYAERYRL